MSSDHAHHDHHGHGYHTHDYSAANVEHWDKEASSYRQAKANAYLSQHVATAILQAYPFDAQTTTLLDFASGPGNVSLGHLAGHCKSVVGADAAPGMVAQFDIFAKERGLEGSRYHGKHVKDITADSSPLADQTFDVIIAYHHFNDVAAVTTSLVRLLKPNGRLIVVDLAQTPHLELIRRGHAAEHTVTHKSGFTREDLKTLFEDTKELKDISVKIADETDKWPPYTLAQAEEADAKGAYFEVLIASGTLV